MIAVLLALRFVGEEELSRRQDLRTMLAFSPVSALTPRPLSRLFTAMQIVTV